MKPSWGPVPKKGDRVGVRLAVQSGGGFTIDFYLNEKHLGRGFTVSDADGSKVPRPLLPAVAFSSSHSQVTIERKAGAPAAGSGAEASGYEHVLLYFQFGCEHSSLALFLYRLFFGSALDSTKSNN